MRFPRLALATTGATAALLLAAPPAVASQLLPGDITIGSTTVDQVGSAYVQLTVSCTDDVDFVNLNAIVRQPVGRTGSISGSGGLSTTCINGVATGTVRVNADSGRFVGGSAVVYGNAFTCTPDISTCEESQVEETRRLTRR